MEMPNNDIDIINSEIAKLRQADVEFGENSLIIDIPTNFSSNPADFDLDDRESIDNAVSKILSPSLKLDSSMNYEETPVSVDLLAMSLASNRKNQSQVGSILAVISVALEQNKRQQTELRNSNDADSEIPFKRRAMTLFGKPYFKDFEGSYPKPNTDTIAKNASQEIGAFTRPSKPWTIEDNDILMESVKRDIQQRKLRPLLNRRQIESAKYEDAIDGSKEKRKLEQSLNAIDKAMTEIKNARDTVYGLPEDSNEIDWLKISTIDMKEQRTAENCRNFWRNVAHPMINKSTWTQEEDDNLVKLTEQFESRNWDKIAELLGTGRSAFLCLKRYQTKFNPLLQKKWTALEDRNLERSVTTFSKNNAEINWMKVSKRVKTKTAEECLHRWNKLKPRFSFRARWDHELDRKLSEAYKVFGSNWMKISKYVPGKSSAQCRDRYKNSLDKCLKTGYWSREEDNILWRAVKLHGLGGQWAKIAHDFLPNRSDNQILIRYKRLILYEELEKKKPANDPQKNGVTANCESTSQELEAPKGPYNRIPTNPHPNNYKKRRVEDHPPSYSLRKRSLDKSYAVDEELSEIEIGSSSDEEVNKPPEQSVDKEAANSGENKASANKKQISTGSKTGSEKPNPHEKAIDDELSELFAKTNKKKMFDEYKSKQKSKPGFSNEIEAKFLGLLENALKLPVSEQNREHPRNVPLLPPNKSTLQAFENLMNNREDLVNSAKLFQFPKNLSPPQPWSRTQVEKFVETSRILGKSFLTNKAINGNLAGELLFDKKLVTEKNKKIIERMRRSLLGANNVASDEVVQNHNQASRLCRQIKSSEEYIRLQLKFFSLFFWPLLLNYSIEKN